MGRVISMSRLFWVGIGAVGGIYGYRKASRAAEEARQRSLRDNVTHAARKASNLVASAKYYADLNAHDETRGNVIDMQTRTSRAL